MNSKSGEVLIAGLVVGAIVGVCILIFDANQTAQEQANITGVGVSPAEVIAENPGSSFLTVAAPAIGGAGVGWLLDSLGGGGNDKASRDNTINVDGKDNSVNVTISGDSESSSSNDGDDGSYNPISN